jgi:methylase of polypeptide subunit release factors
VPGVATWATRRITGWRLDRDRLAAVAAAAAPGTAILDAGTGTGAAGPGQQASAPE